MDECRSPRACAAGAQIYVAADRARLSGSPDRYQLGIFGGTGVYSRVG
jgi:hypothetical protein